MPRVLDVVHVLYKIATPQGVVRVTFERSQITIEHKSKRKVIQRVQDDTAMSVGTMRARKIVEAYLSDF